jgi:cation transport ATPase
LPFAIVFWVIGHVLLWFSHKLAKRGRNSTENNKDVDGRWPLTIILLALLFGGIFIFGFFAIISQFVLSNNSTSKFPLMLALWLPPSICFIGILLRQIWSRVLASAVFIIVAMFLLYQMIESILRSNHHSTIDWLTAITIVLVCLFLGQHIFRSSRIKAFYAK